MVKGMRTCKDCLFYENHVGRRGECIKNVPGAAQGARKHDETLACTKFEMYEEQGKRRENEEGR